MRVSERPKVGSQLTKYFMQLKKLAKEMEKLLLLAKDYSICIFFVHPIKWVGRVKSVGKALAQKSYARC